MTHDGQNIDDVADAFLRPHAAAQAREADALAQRRKTRSRFLGWAAAVLAILQVGDIVYVYLRYDRFTWSPVFLAAAMTATAISAWRRR